MNTPSQRWVFHTAASTQIHTGKKTKQNERKTYPKQKRRNHQMHSDTVTYICTDNQGIWAFTHTRNSCKPIPPPLQIKQLIKPSSYASICSSTTSLLFSHKTPKYIYKASAHMLKTFTYEECPCCHDCLHTLHEVCVTHTYTHMSTYTGTHRLEDVGKKITLTLIAWRSTARWAAPPLAFTCRLLLLSPAPSVFL